MNKISRATAEQYRWGQECEGWLLLDGDDLTVVEECVPPGGCETRHRHATAREFFYVLAGEATLEVEGIAHRLVHGEGLHVPPGSSHQLRNDGTEPLRFLVASSPDSHGDRSETPV